MGITESLARFIVETDSDAIPAKVRREATRSLVNWSGCALGGANHPAVSAALQALSPFAGPGRASVLGRSERVDALHAALFNGISSHVLDFDDTHPDTLVHPSGPVLSALLALSQHHPVNGKDFLDATAMGIEAECRVAQAVGKAHYDIGWHVTGTAGGFGAAAACGRALKLNPQQMTWALGIAATQAAGLREMFGSMCKSLHPGKAAQNGLGAALLAQAGFTSSMQSIEGPRGFAKVTSTQPHEERLLEGIGERWEALDNTYKPYACGLVIHPVIDACVAAHASGKVAPGDVEQVMLYAHPLVLELTGKTCPTTGLEGKFSVYHAAAMALLEGRSLSSHFTDAAVAQPAVVALRDRVKVESVPDMRVDEARAVFMLRDGTRWAHHVEHALGSLGRPMSDQDLSQKFMLLAQKALPVQAAERALQACWRMEELENAGAIALALSLPHATP
ncbi:MAG: MmgE/PrpD family protein [Variovorax sp.]|nr:MAG: MmgE/PrpD family protein [Variovorax sp.]